MTKLLIAAVMVVIPVFGWLVLAGYALRITRQVAGGSDLPLPEWQDWGELFLDGLKALGIAFIWTLPTTIISVCLRFGTDDSAGVILLTNCLTLPISLALGFVLPAALARLATTGSFNAGLEVGRVIETVRRDPADYLIVLLFGFVAGFLAAAGLIALCVGVLVTIPYAQFMLAHLYGQAYFRAQGGNVGPTPVART